MSIFEKLLEIQKSVDSLTKDEENKSDKYKYVSSDLVLNTIRPKMNELKLLLVPVTKGARIHTGETKSGTTRFLTELDKEFVWIDCESGEQYAVPFYAQGVDLAGEKGVGKAETYAEKYFLMKLFHIGTSKDDPDNDGRTGAGEKPLKGTQAQKENADYFRKAISQMLNELYSDAEKIKAAMISLTKSDARQYAGVDALDKVSDTALPVVYASLKKGYTKKTGKEFTLKNEENEEA